jgi:hypothetical protein
LGDPTFLFSSQEGNEYLEIFPIIINDNIDITIVKKTNNIIFFGPSSFDLNSSEVIPIRPMKIT